MRCTASVLACLFLLRLVLAFFVVSAFLFLALLVVPAGLHCSTRREASETCKRRKRVDWRWVSLFFALGLCDADATQQCVGFGVHHFGSKAKKQIRQLRCQGPWLPQEFSWATEFCLNKEHSRHARRCLGSVSVECRTAARIHRPDPIYAIRFLVGAFCLECLGVDRHRTKRQNHIHRRLHFATVAESHILHPAVSPTRLNDPCQRQKLHPSCLQPSRLKGAGGQSGVLTEPTAGHCASSHLRCRGLDGRTTFLRWSGQRPKSQHIWVE